MAKNILVAEDDDSVRRVHEKILGMEGHKVHSFRNGLEAYNFMDKNRDLIDLVLTDFEMPIMGGDELIEKLKDNGHKAKIILFSGHIEDEVKKKYANSKYNDFMKKPFDLDKYLAKVNKYLDSK